MRFEKLAAGSTVYAVFRVKMGNTSVRTTVVRPVLIVSVSPMSRTVRAIAHGDRERSYGEAAVKRWRQDEPVLVSEGLLGQKRLATREEAESLRESAEA
jgi:hypothetical protein